MWTMLITWEVGLDPLLGSGKYFVRSNDRTYSVSLLLAWGTLALSAPGNPASCSACLSSSCPFPHLHSLLLVSFSAIFPLCFLDAVQTLATPVPWICSVCSIHLNSFFPHWENIAHLFANWKNKKQVLRPIQFHILCDPMNCTAPGLPVHCQLPEFTQTHVHWVGDAIPPSHPLLPS